MVFPFRLFGGVTTQHGRLARCCAFSRKGNKQMQIQINSNNSIDTGESFGRWANAELSESFSRYKDESTRIEVHMSDENGEKVSPDHTRCMMEARLANREPVAVNHHGANQDEAFRGASEKLKRVLEHTLGKLRDHRARESIRREPDLDNA
jgi:ribosome-associated translation inhibitor RaiA